MPWEAWLTVAVIAVSLVAIAREWLDSAIALGGALGVLLLAGIITPELALQGFAVAAVGILSICLAWRLR